MKPGDRPTDVLLLMFDEVELLDFAGPYEVFTTANRLARRDAPSADAAHMPVPPFRLRTASPMAGPCGPGPAWVCSRIWPCTMRQRPIC